jgi:hypothetical protein
MQNPKDVSQTSVPPDPAKGSSNYRDRPADEGKHGDGAEEPTAAPLGNGEQQKAPETPQHRP